MKNSTTEVHPLDANLISSERPNNKHALLLDLDINSYYVASSTNGHAHLYLDTNLDIEGLTEIIGVLKKYGIIQQGIYNQLKDRGSLNLRPPGVKKDEWPDDANVEEYKESLIAQTESLEKKVIPKHDGFLSEMFKNSGSIQPFEFTSTKPFYPNELKTLISGYKYYGEEFSVTVPEETLSTFVQRLCIILDIPHIETHKTHAIPDVDFYMTYLDHKIMDVKKLLAVNATELIFHKSDYQYSPNPQIDWPSWDVLIKKIGEINV